MSIARSTSPASTGIMDLITARWKSCVPALFLILVTLVAYLPTMGNGFIWDDDQYVTRNGTLRSLEGLGQIWFRLGVVPQYYPLVHTTFWLEFHLWGLNPAGYHLVNVLFHAIAVVLLWRVLTKLKIPGAFLAAAIFGLHPVQVESVAWITELKNVLSAVFYFAAALSYLRFVELKDAGVSDGRDRYFYAASLFLFVAALWSKTVTYSLPMALLLICWWKQGRLRRNDIGPLLPFFVIGAGMGMLTIWMEKHSVGAVGAAWALNFFDRCLIAGRALWFYAAKLIWPTDLTFIYPRWDISTAVWWQWLFPVATIIIVVALWFLRNRIGRGPLTAVLFFAITLFPALGFVNVYPFRYSFVADHFQYLASIGLITLVAVGAVHATARWGSRLGIRPDKLKFGLHLLPLALGVLTWQQTHIYHDLETLWRDTLGKSPASAIAHNNLGTLLSARGEFAEAERHFRETLRVEPDDPETLSNLGVALAGQGNVTQALELLNRAVALNPNNAEVHGNLGKVLAGLDRPAEAITSFEAAIRLQPQRAEFYYNLGSVLAGLGKIDEAIEQFRKALEHRLDYPDAHNNLGGALARQSKYEDAIQHYIAALRINPNHVVAHNNLGDALMRLRNVDAAVQHFREALRLKPDYVNAHFNLGNALALQKKYDEAVEQFNETLRLLPTYAPAHRNLGLALARLGRREEAMEQFKAALKLQPDNEEIKQQLRALGEQAPE